MQALKYGAEIMIQEFIAKAEKDLPVYIGDVRRTFNEAGKYPFGLEITLYDESKKRFPLRLPAFSGAAETAFVESYVHATVYNLLSALGGRKLTVFTDTDDPSLLQLANGLDRVFMTGSPSEERNGYGKALNVNERVLRTLFGDAVRFSFEVRDAEEFPAEEPVKVKEAAGGVFTDAVRRAARGAYLGLDVGGTDIKLAASVNGSLRSFAEYDWFPAEFTEAEQLTGPILELAKNAAAECGVERFDAIGLSFPDVVVRNTICGGETHKTRGMRENRALDYEKQFAIVSRLGQDLSNYVNHGRVMITNDGNMAAFTAAVEETAAGKDTSRGFFAHTLGTELGTGWVRPDGSIPEIPLEVYNFIIDLGSYGQRRFAPKDVRSINNFNTGLPGTLQRCCSQSGAFRLAAKLLPENDPGLWEDLVRCGFFRWGIFCHEEGMLLTSSAPKDMRKRALEYLINAACSGDHPYCAEILREIGEYLAVTREETEFILSPETPERSLFGRFVKAPVSFELIREGALRRSPGTVLYAADDGLANTPLMQELSRHPKYTVAQFAQAVGAIYYAALSLT